ncbi:uncharacterized protein LOC108917523 [Anoplophora glabripennis]|uniref:uncharacterized protein LOC108917523 n=1 Tax=Anoplophora glabripennis TaxID=217634 RepID=UPI00087558B8|nr:uncharacterized protein LOC108917523 [Anoplophora glabripennis]
MFATSYGTLEFLHKCLSWRCWIPLSKLVYGAYLAHYAIQTRAAYNTVNSSEFNFFDIVTYGLSDIILAFLSALGLYLTVEAPTRIILKVLLFPSKPENKKDKQDAEVQEQVKSETRL